MQVWILPVFPLTGAVERRAMEMDFFIRIERDANVMSGEQMLALGAKPHLAERPPVFQRIGRLKKLELAPDGFWEGIHIKIVDLRGSDVEFAAGCAPTAPSSRRPR